MMLKRGSLLALAVVLGLSLSCRRGSKDKHEPDDKQNLKNGEQQPLKTGQLPGAEVYPQPLQQAMHEAVTARGKGYKPRTKHLNKDGTAKYTNRLALESSPYLVQHAHNPVNWYAWGDEAFATAKRLNRPVLLSVGYSTCHWCHVMEEQSFEDEEIARYMNENYVAIKVDREERPDVDSIYMAALRRGGWPMTVWLTPDRKPFFGGTYFPPRSGKDSRRPGFLEILTHFVEQWTKDPKGIAETAAKLARRVRMVKQARRVGTIDAKKLLHDAASRYKDVFDPVHGGIKNSRTKFPSHVALRFMMRYYRRTGDRKALEVATTTLRKMANGGIYDHAGGGFHRYSTDPRWLVPHFEKMLYDNALLVPSYLEAFQITGNPMFARVAREILRYVRRDMTAPGGGFYSATDADNLGPTGHREEGQFFTWTPNELLKVLGRDQQALANSYYNVTGAGDYEGRNILHVTRTLNDVATQLAMPVDLAASVLEKIKNTLYEERKRRSPPLRDDKILAAWNGLMISAYARAHLALGKNKDGGPSYLDQATRAARFVLTKMRKNGRLLRTYMDGKAKLTGYVNDYAFVIAGLIDLFEASGDKQWLDQAIALDRVLARYYEDARGGFFMTASDAEKLLAREKTTRDGAVPNGNSIHAMNLLRLAELTTHDSYRTRAKKLFDSYASILNGSSTSLGEMLSAIDFYTDEAKEIIIVTPKPRSDATAMLQALRKKFVPNHVLAVVPVGAKLDELAKVLPLVKHKEALRGKVTAYVCVQQRCELPTSDPMVFAAQIAKVTKLSTETTTPKLSPPLNKKPTPPQAPTKNK